MRAIGATCVAIGVLWLTDALLNGGRYSNVIESAIMSLIGRAGQMYRRKAIKVECALFTAQWSSVGPSRKPRTNAGMSAMTSRERVSA